MRDDTEVDTTDLPAADAGREDLSARVEVDLGALTDGGKVRPHNEDNFFVGRFERTMHTLLTSLPPGCLPGHYALTVYGMLVADGIGGAAAGEVASGSAIAALVELVLRTPDWIMSEDEGLARQVLRRMGQRYQQVQAALAERARAEPELAGMGTTMTLAGSLGARAVLAHVGDSRAYLFRRGRLQRLTHDDTVAQSLVEAGVIRPEEAATHPFRHMLTEALSSLGGKEVRAELSTLRLADGDRLLLCTDGLTEMVPEADIAGALGKEAPAAEVCAALVGMALDRGGRDNVTVVLARYRIPTGPEA